MDTANLSPLEDKARSVCATPTGGLIVVTHQTRAWRSRVPNFTGWRLPTGSANRGSDGERRTRDGPAWTLARGRPVRNTTTGRPCAYLSRERCLRSAGLCSRSRGARAAEARSLRDGLSSRPAYAHAAVVRNGHRSGAGGVSEQPAGRPTLQGRWASPGAGRRARTSTSPERDTCSIPPAWGFTRIHTAVRLAALRTQA